jgi:hypothetical protein
VQKPRYKSSSFVKEEVNSKGSDDDDDDNNNNKSGFCLFTL